MTEAPHQKYFVLFHNLWQSPEFPVSILNLTTCKYISEYKQQHKYMYKKYSNYCLNPIL